MADELIGARRPRKVRDTLSVNWGGARKDSGRKSRAEGGIFGPRRPRSTTKTAKEIVEALLRNGKSPLLFLAKVYMDPKQSITDRLEAARIAAKYCHPALASA